MTSLRNILISGRIISLGENPSSETRDIEMFSGLNKKQRRTKRRVFHFSRLNMWDDNGAGSRVEAERKRNVQHQPYGNPNLCIRFMSMDPNPICCSSSVEGKAKASQNCIPIINFPSAHKTFPITSTIAGF